MEFRRRIVEAFGGVAVFQPDSSSQALSVGSTEDVEKLAEFFAQYPVEHNSTVIDRTKVTDAGFIDVDLTIRRESFTVETVRRGFLVNRVGSGFVKQPVDLIQTYSPSEPVAVLKPLPEIAGTEKDYFWYPPETDLIRKAVSAGMNVLLVGPPGSGKSTLLERLFTAEGIDYIPVNLNGDIGLDDLVGSMVIDSSGTMVFRYGVLPVAMGVNGDGGRGLILDELDACTPEALFSIQRVAEGKDLVLTRNFGQRIARGEKFRFAATANTTGRGDDTCLYRGTHILNEAFLDRFQIVIQVGYPPAKNEKMVLQGRTGVDKYNADKIVNVAGLARAALAAGELASTFGVRRTIAWAQLIQMGFTTGSAYKWTILDRVSETDKKVLVEFFQRVYGVEPSLS